MCQEQNGVYVLCVPGESGGIAVKICSTEGLVYGGIVQHPVG